MEAPHDSHSRARLCLPATLASARRPVTPPPPHWLAGLLEEHRNTHGPLYGGFLSDHLPMMALALHGLGAGRTVIEARRDAYAQRLDAPTPLRRNPPESLATALGDRAAYAPLLGFFDAEIQALGMPGALAAHLPSLISGWVRDAFHPIIRLAYGIRFGLASEVAAGLAYLASAGPDPALGALATNARPKRALTFPQPSPAPGRTFEEKCQAVIAAGALDGAVHVVGDNRRRAAETALAAFHQTGDFFALHLVTGCHALLVCADATGLREDALLNAGLFAGYLAAGAPAFSADAPPRAWPMDEEHHAKLAFSCAELAKLLDSERFRQAAAMHRAGLPAPYGSGPSPP